LAVTAPDVAERLAGVRDRIAAACARAGRDAASVKLVAVCKRIALERVVAACAAGHWDLGENRIQEALPRQLELAEQLALASLPVERVRWHFVGHLQSNKAGKAAGAFTLLHAVASGRLVDRLETAAARADCRQPLLVEVNMSREPQKHGVAPAEAERLFERLLGCDHLEPRGLMTMARADAGEAELRRTFSDLRELAEALRSSTGLGLPELSMGMSGDFEAAIAEGSTLVRIGTALFGPRAAPV
jgi:pyridoxal phosphate enzyme (YggS family)